MIFRSSWASNCAVVLLAWCWTSAADARQPAPVAIDISASRLPDALAEFSRETGVSIGIEGELPAIRTPAVHGVLGVADALARLLVGTGYTARQVGKHAWRIERARPPAAVEVEPPRNPGSPDHASEAIAAEPIIVTAAKRVATLDDLPMAVALVRLDAMHLANPASGTALIAAQSEGLAMTSLGPGRNRLFLRGVADSPFSGESQSTVAVVLDEARVTYSAPDPDIRLVDVERVEVLKGPQGSYYGTGTLGGIYHIVTRRAQVDKASLALSANVESLAHGSTGQGGTIIANLPVVPGMAALRLVGYAGKEAGWVDTGSRKDSNSTRLLGGRANLGLLLRGDWRVDLSGLVQLLDSHDSRYVYAAGARQRPAQLPEPHDNDLRHVSARISRSSGPLDIVLSTGVSWHEVSDRFDATVGGDGFGLPAPALLDDSRMYNLWDSEARIAGQTGGLRWLLGASYVKARQDSRWTLVSSTGTLETIDDDRRDTREMALFGDVTVPFSPAVSLDLGGRLFRSTITEIRQVPAGRISRDSHRTGFTPGVALKWKPGPGQLVFLRYASAVRRGGSDIGPTGDLEVLNGDELQNLEGGWRGPLGTDGRFDIGLFASRWQNMQSDMQQASGLIESENAGDARIFGAEATVDVPIRPGWRIEAGATVTDATLVRNRLRVKLDDRRLPVVPRLTARATLTHDFTLGKAAMQLRATLRHVGDRRLSFDPAIDRSMDAFLETRIEAQAKLGNMQIMLAAENLAGGSRDSFAYGNPLRFATARQYTPQRPASLSASLLFDF